MLAPVQRLTRAAEDVSQTGDLSQRIDVDGKDELSRLASTFNTMLGALEDSARSQRQLVSDASHELRTPLTSLRTNIEVLARDEALPAGEREQLLRDVTEQLTEMTALVAELVELARGDQAPVEPEDVRLDLVTADAIERTRRNRPGVSFEPDLQESMIRGVPSNIERAISNLLDNAAKWSPPDGQIDVTVHDGELTVRDHGPGIDSGRPALRLRPLLPRSVGARHARLGARTRDRPAGRRGPRRHSHGRARPGRRHADAADAAELLDISSGALRELLGRADPLGSVNPLPDRSSDMKSTKIKIAGISAAAAALVGGGAAIAADRLSPDAESDAVVADAAKQLGIDAAEA